MTSPSLPGQQRAAGAGGDLTAVEKTVPIVALPS